MFDDKAATNQQLMADDHQQRSEYIRCLVRSSPWKTHSAGSVAPTVVIQYWDTAPDVPDDVKSCIATWEKLETSGIKHRLYSYQTAREYIETHLTDENVRAFERCSHPAMRSDYFRLCYIVGQGGLYVDADDIYMGADISALAESGVLMLQPLCYDLVTESMADPAQCAAEDDRASSRIFYVNNNPIVAPPNHPVLELALQRATANLGSAKLGRDIQSLTGPGNLSHSLVCHSVGHALRDFVFLTEKSGLSATRWRLGYRSDERNWRIWSKLSE